MGITDSGQAGSILIHLTGEQVKRLPADVRLAVDDLVARLTEAGTAVPIEPPSPAAGGGAGLRTELDRLLAEISAHSLALEGDITCPVVMEPAPVFVIDRDIFVLPPQERG